MLAVLSPAKNLDYESEHLAVEATQPRLLDEAETLVLYIFDKYCCNQVTTNYKEHINAYKAPTKQLKSSVEKNYWDNS